MSGEKPVTVEQVMQGHQMDDQKLLKLAEPPPAEKVIRSLQQVIGVFIPWARRAD